MHSQSADVLAELEAAALNGGAVELEVARVVASPAQQHRAVQQQQHAPHPKYRSISGDYSYTSNSGSAAAETHTSAESNLHILMVDVERGLGAKIKMEVDSVGGQQVVAREVMPGTTAAQCGLMAGDVLLSINGHSLTGIVLEEAVELLAAARGKGPARNHTTLQIPIGARAGPHGISFRDLRTPEGSSVVVISSIAPGSTASRTALRTGQVVLAIDNHSMEQSTAARAVKTITTAGLRKQESVAVTVSPGTFTLEYTQDSVAGRAHSRTPGAESYMSATSYENQRRREGGGNGNGSGRGGGGRGGGTPWPTATQQRDLHNLSASSMPSAAGHGGSDYYGAAHRERELLQKALASERLKRGQTEQDYDEIISLLEAEVAHLRAQLLGGPNEADRLLIKYRQRCIVLGVQLNKAVASKRLADTAITKLLTFTRNARATLTEANSQPRAADAKLRHRPSDGNPPPSASWSQGDVCMAPSATLGTATTVGSSSGLQVGTVERLQPGGGPNCLVKFQDPNGGLPVLEAVRIRDLRGLDGHNSFAVAAARPGSNRSGRKPTRLPGSYLSGEEATILKEAEYVMQAVTTILEEDALPFGWEEAFTNDGQKYYIDHASQSTSWVHPSTLIVEQGERASRHRPKPPSLSAMSKLENLSHETYG